MLKTVILLLLAPAVSAQADSILFEAKSFSGARETARETDPVTLCQAQATFGTGDHPQFSVFVRFKSGSYETFKMEVPNPTLSNGQEYVLGGKHQQTQAKYSAGILSVKATRDLPDSFTSHLHQEITLKATISPDLRSLGSLELKARDRHQIWFGFGDHNRTKVSCQF